MVDKVMEIAKKILERVKEWWNKFKPKQKTLIICVAAGVLICNIHSGRCAYQKTV